MLPDPFAAAAVASRIAFEPFDAASAINLAISLGGGGKPNAAWRDTLESGAPDPVATNRIAHVREIQTSVIEAMR